MSSGRNTQEYQKVKKSFPKIAAAIAGVIGPTSNELLAAGLITNGQKEKARNSTRDADDRASDLVSLILNKIEQDSQNFYAFVRVLKEDLDTFQTVLDHMGVSTESDPSTASKNGAAPGPAAGSSKAFSDDLSPTDLVAWLSQQFQAKGLTLEASLGQKLIDDDINGEAFLDLEDKDLTEMGFTRGQRMKILKIIQSVKECKADDQNQTSPKPTEVEKKAVAPSGTPGTPIFFNICMNMGKAGYVDLIIIDASHSCLKLLIANSLIKVRCIDFSTHCLSMAKLTLLKGKGKEVEIIKAVTPNWTAFGQHLDFDPVGRDLDTIEKRNNKDPAESCKDMFQHWLNGNGVDATWDNVIEFLDAVGLKVLAKDVKAIIY